MLARLKLKVFAGVEKQIVFTLFCGKTFHENKAGMQFNYHTKMERIIAIRVIQLF